MLGESKKSFKLKLLYKYFYGEKNNSNQKARQKLSLHKNQLFFFFSPNQPSFTYKCRDTDVLMFYMEIKEIRGRNAKGRDSYFTLIKFPINNAIDTAQSSH